MIDLVRTKPADEDFAQLVKLLDAELAEIDGEDHAYYAHYNTLGRLQYALVAYVDGVPVACGALKEFTPTQAEIKRMFTDKAWRGEGIASLVLAELELWARELGFSSCVLETGKRQPRAIALYERAGYRVIPNYGQYAGLDNSVCFEKKLE